MDKTNVDTLAYHFGVREGTLVVTTALLPESTALFKLFEAIDPDVHIISVWQRGRPRDSLLIRYARRQPLAGAPQWQAIEGRHLG